MKLINRKNQIIDFLKTVCYSSCHIQFQLVCRARKSYAITIKASLVLFLPDSLRPEKQNIHFFTVLRKRQRNPEEEQILCIKGKREKFHQSIFYVMAHYCFVLACFVGFFPPCVPGGWFYLLKSETSRAIIIKKKITYTHTCASWCLRG